MEAKNPNKNHCSASRIQLFWTAVICDTMQKTGWRRRKRKIKAMKSSRAILTTSP
jgi:hypothetical protein